MSEKITPSHLDRKAIVYIRQSSAYQVSHNTESRRMQYAMQDHVRELGWSQTEVIDEDLGRSAAGTVSRAGFERMVAEVCLGKVGAVAARELSRFARNSRDWQKLIEVCRVVDTLLIDQEAIYNPRHGNDRLLLGLKGSLNEYELDLLRQRAWDARREKALRGELIVSVPVGFVKTLDGNIELDPDRRVQETIRLVYRKFFELGTARQVHQWFIEQGLQFPARRRGILGWEIRWRRATYAVLHHILANPVYAGAYAFGRSQTQMEYHDGQTCKTQVRQPREKWHALIPNHHEGYIDWDQFERIQQMLSQNQMFYGGTSLGAPKQGSALLVGLLRCRRCGRKLSVFYTGRCHDVTRYTCCRGYLDNMERRCISFGGVDVDRVVSRELLRVVQPAAIEASLQAGDEASAVEDEVLSVLRRELQAARYSAERAEKQYDLADPENRLVAEELERRWNVALDRVAELERRIADEEDRHGRMKLPDATAFRDLATNLQAVWDAPQTDVRLKKRLLRTLIHEVVADVDSTAGNILLVIHWHGGVHTELSIRKRRRGQNRIHTSPDIVAAIRQLVLVGDDHRIAGWLNASGVPTGHGNRWTRGRVASFRSKRQIPRYDPESEEVKCWVTLNKAAAVLGISTATLRLAAEHGTIEFQHPLARGPWLFHRDTLKSQEAEALVLRARRRCGRRAAASFGQQNLHFSDT
jgi:DNA invertase Pin-like site-specific DNA recombinase